VTKKTAEKKLPPRLDPVLPLPAGTGIPPIKQGQGSDILHATSPTKVVELPYNAFYMLWESIEARAARDYQKYIDGPLAHVAEAELAAVHAFRSAAADRVLPIMSEERARKARLILAKHDKDEAKAKKKPKSEAPETPSGATESPEKRDRCSAIHRSPKMALVRCSGPAEHKRKKHKGKSKYGEIVEWTDDA
jgi:hypothetical protein